MEKRPVRENPAANIHVSSSSQGDFEFVWGVASKRTRQHKNHSNAELAVLGHHGRERRERIPLRFHGNKESWQVFPKGKEVIFSGSWYMLGLFREKFFRWFLFCCSIS